MRRERETYRDRDRDRERQRQRQRETERIKEVLHWKYVRAERRKEVMG